MPPPAAVLSSFSVAVNFTLVAAFALMISVVLQQLPGAHSLGDVSVKALRFRSPGDCCVDGEGVGDNPSYCRAFTDTTEPDSDGTMMPCCWKGTPSSPIPNVLKDRVKINRDGTIEVSYGNGQDDFLVPLWSPYEGRIEFQLAPGKPDCFRFPTANDVDYFNGIYSITEEELTEALNLINFAYSRYKESDAERENGHNCTYCRSFVSMYVPLTKLDGRGHVKVTILKDSNLYHDLNNFWTSWTEKITGKGHSASSSWVPVSSADGFSMVVNITTTMENSMSNQVVVDIPPGIACPVRLRSWKHVDRNFEGFYLPFRLMRAERVAFKRQVRAVGVKKQLVFNSTATRGWNFKSVCDFKITFSSDYKLLVPPY